MATIGRRIAAVLCAAVVIGCRSAPPARGPTAGGTGEIGAALRGQPRPEPPPAGGTSAATGSESSAEPPADPREKAPVRPAAAPMPGAGAEKAASKNESRPGAGAPAKDERVAEVGDKVVTRGELIERLLYSEGPKLLDAMIELELARAMASERGIAVSEQDLTGYVAQWIEEQVKRKSGAVIPHEQLMALAQSVAAQRGESWQTAEMNVRKLYHLDRIARQKITVSDDELRREFVKQYGEKLTVRCIALANQADAAAVRKQLDGGADFAELARKVSQDAVTAARGGMCEPFGRNALPKAVEDEVFSLKDGQLSRPVYYPFDGRFYLFQLISRTPAQNARFEDVQARLRGAVEAEKVRLGIGELMRELKARKTRVVFHDERLRLKESK